MAKEAIEAVKNAEEKASQIITSAEAQAREMVAKAGEDAQNRLKTALTKENQETDELLKNEDSKIKEEFEKYKEEVAAVCKKRRQEILDNSETIIGRIIDKIKG